MRRLLTILTAAGLLVVSLAVGVIAADLPFWRRAASLPLGPDATYLPVAHIGAAGPGPLEVDAGPADVDTLAVEAAAASAREAGVRALLVMRDGALVLERYFGADDSASLLPASLVARPVAAMAVGLALADGSIAGLDVPVSRYLPEWEGEARGRITPRQLLEETSGLEGGGDLRGLLRRSPWDDFARLPAFATSRGVRMWLGNDFPGTALGFGLAHEPGGFRHESPANTQLAALLVERAAHTPYEDFIDARLWVPVGGGPAELPLDRAAGMPAAHCCWRAAARDQLRIVSLLATRGVHDGRQVLPEGWVEEMARPARVDAHNGLQLSRSKIDALDVLGASVDDGSAFWVAPERGLAVLSIAGPAGVEESDWIDMLLRAFVPR
jgi:CubicO group peptidase (beta-lactamase class C family)